MIPFTESSRKSVDQKDQWLPGVQSREGMPGKLQETLSRDVYVNDFVRMIDSRSDTYVNIL